MPYKGFLANVFERSQPLNRRPRSERRVVQEVNIRNANSEDDSDSEIFRVKRRSFNKMERKIARDFTSVNTDQQVPLFMSGFYIYCAYN